MPTIKNVSFISEQDQRAPNGDAVQRLIARFPYKDYGITDDKGDAIVVTMPGDMRIRMPRKTVEYYSKVAGGDVQAKEDYSPMMHKITAAASSKDGRERASRLKEIVRHFAPMEFKPEKYSFMAYVLGRPNLTVEQARSLHAAYADENPDGLPADERQVYDMAVDYALAYYKFLIGMLTVID